MTLTISTTTSTIFGEEVTYSGSLQFTSGNYIFSERTNSMYLLNGLSMSVGPLQISANLPIIMQNTPWVSYTNTGAIPTGGTQSSEVSNKGHGGSLRLPDTTEYQEMGLGDLFINANLRLIKEGKAHPSISFTAGFKVPLSDVDMGFGTGEADYGTGISLIKSLDCNFVFIDLSYWVLGDLPDLELKDPIGYSIAFGRSLASGKCSGLISFSGYSEIINDVEPSAQVGVGLTYRLESKAKLTGGLSLGVTDSAPDFLVSLGWGIEL